MPTVGKKLDYNDWKDNPKSKLSKQKYITTPEERHTEMAPATVGAAEKQVEKMGGGK